MSEYQYTNILFAHFSGLQNYFLHSVKNRGKNVTVRSPCNFGPTLVQT